MKTFQYILWFIAGILLYSCAKEDAIDSELKTYRRSYDSTSTDPVKKFEADYYYKYDKVFITDVDTVDYLFNFKYKNNIFIEQAEQNETHLLAGIKLMKDLFLDAYTPEFIKEYFPFSLILGDDILDNTGYTTKQVDMFVANSFIALNIGKMTQNLNTEERKQLSAKLHKALLVDICWQNTKSINLDQFFKHTESTYGKKQNKEFTKEELYEAGYINPDPSTFFHTIFPTKNSDIQDWINFILLTPQEELTEIINTYDLMKVKYQSLDETLKNFGIDYRTLIK
jgi:lipoprotein